MDSRLSDVRFTHSFNPLISSLALEAYPSAIDLASLYNHLNAYQSIPNLEVNPKIIDTRGRMSLRNCRAL